MNGDKELRVHAVLPHSTANGPGVRFTVWTQGCTLGCPSCFNPQTHPNASETVRPVADLVDEALAEASGAGTDRIEGVTLTGGEPLEQPGPVAAFCRAVKMRSDLGIIVLTGFVPAEIEADPARFAAVADADMVIAGRYNPRLHLGTGLRGSANKAYWARTGRYRAEDLAEVPDLEIDIAADGTVTVTGMPHT